MFLVKDSSSLREERILEMLKEDASLSFLLSVIHFEWTIRRAIIALGTSPNVEIRQKLKKQGGGLDGYKKVWKDEVFPRVNKRLTEVITDWDNLIKVFKLRIDLVHGISSCSQDYAIEKANYVIDCSRIIRKLSSDYGFDLDKRLPIKRKKLVSLPSEFSGKQVEIIVLTKEYSQVKKKSLKGILQTYANSELMTLESTAWENFVEGKYGDR